MKHRTKTRVLAGCAMLTLLASSVLAEFKPVKTAVIRGGDKAQKLSVDITGLKTLYLAASIGGDTHKSDQAIWGEPRLIDKNGKSVNLTSLKPASVEVGWGKLFVNQNQNSNPLSIAGEKLSDGFWAHGPSVLEFKLTDEYVRFEARVGIDTGAGKEGSVEFIVTNVMPSSDFFSKGNGSTASLSKTATKSGKPALPPISVPANLLPGDKSPHKFNAEAASKLVQLGIDKLVFVRRHTLLCSHSYTEHIDARWLPGGGLCMLDLKTGQVADLFPQLGTGVTNRFDISYDAKKIIFDYKKGPKDGYRIYEADIDGKNLRQLTFPPDNDAELVKLYGYGTNDMQPCYLPNGEIMFTSTRCMTSTLCNGADVFTTTVLHKMDANGQNIRRLSSNPVSEFAPTLMPDGRILYMRWEYNRKGAGAVKALWAMLPDGTASSEVYGNDIVDPETMIYGRPIPGTNDKVVFLGCSHWGPNNAVGTVVVLDMNKDTQTRDAMNFITKDIDAKTHGGYTFLVDGKWVNDSTGMPGRLFKDPYPISEKLFLASCKPKGLTWNDPKGYGLILLDEQGNDTPLYRDEETSCWLPYPLKARTVPPSPASAINADLASKNLAHCILGDVNMGLNGVPKGAVKYIRIMEQNGRPWTARNRWKGDGESLAHTTLGHGILGMQAQHGIVPVEEDGSASFYVPAGRNIYFQALDQNFMAIQTERTYVNYMPGETRSCVGCHEHTRTASGERSLAASKALRRQPSMPGPQPGETTGQKLFDYARQVQPIWNKHCIGCHGETKPSGGLDLTGGLTTLYCRSYENLLGIGVGKGRNHLPLVGGQVDENSVRAYVEYTAPYYFGAYSSILASIYGKFEPHFDFFGDKAAKMTERAKALREQHKNIKLAPDEFVRIVNWLDSSCQYYNSYWGMKNIQHKDSPYFRPDLPFLEGIGSEYPASLKPLYSSMAPK